MNKFEQPQIPDPEEKQEPVWIEYFMAALTVIGFWFMCMVLWAIKG